MSTPEKELIQSATQLQVIATQVIAAADAMSGLSDLRDAGLLDFNILTNEQLAALGLQDAAQLGKFLDQSATMQDVRRQALMARGLRG
jgi:hypothetical protein